MDFMDDLDGQSLDSLSLFAASDTTSIASFPGAAFTDPQLQSLIEQALQGNTDLLSAQQRIKEAEATLMSAKLSYLPAFVYAHSAGWRQQFRQFQRLVDLFRHCLGKLKSIALVS